MPRKLRAVSPGWLEDGPDSWILSVGPCECYVICAEDRRWHWSCYMGPAELASASRGLFSLVEAQLAAEDRLRALATGIASVLPLG